jgi:hypothetical protein
MAKLTSLFAPVKATVSPGAGTLRPGMIVTIDTNVPARVHFTLDDSIPTEGAVGTTSADAPVEIVMAISATLKFQAVDSARPNNYTKIQSFDYVIARNNPLEVFRDGKHFFNLLRTDIVDENFFAAVASVGWTVPKSAKPYTFLFRNPESIKVLTRVLHNGRDTRTDGFPTLDVGGAAEFPMVIRGSENVIEIQTQESIGS